MPAGPSLPPLAALGALACLLAAGCGGTQQRVSTAASTTTTGRVDPPPAPSTPRPAPSVPAKAGTPAARPAPPAHVAPAHPVPASFRIARGAPSDAQVRAELAQMQRIQHAQLQLSAAPASGALLLPWLDEPKTNQVSIASVFRDYGLGLACGGLLGVNQLGVAHKTAPCGTVVDFRYAGRQLRLPVIDRGPYIAGREWDLTGAAADALGFPGLGQRSSR